MDPLKEPAQVHGVFRWTTQRVGAHLNRFLWGGVAFAAVSVAVSGVFVVPENPTWGQRLVNGAATLSITTLAVLVLLVVPWAIIRAPYEQRNELRRKRLEEHDTRSVPELTIVPSSREYWPSLVVTNNGPTDTFQAFAEIAGRPSSRQRLFWGSLNTKRDNEASELVTGEYDRLSIHSWEWRIPLGAELQIDVTFLSKTRKPLTKSFSIRHTLLGRVEAKEASDVWARRGHEWFNELSRLKALLEDARTELPLLPITEGGMEASKFTNTLMQSLRNSEVLGNSFYEEAFDTNKSSVNTPHSTVKTIATQQGVVAGYVDCCGRWIAALEAAEAEERRRG